MASNVYHLTGIFTCAQVQAEAGGSRPQEAIRIWDSAKDTFVFGASADEAKYLFETELRRQPEGENPTEVTIRKVSVAPVVGQLLTETGNVPLNLARILEKMDSLLESTAADDFEQGYWVDVDKTVPADKLSFSLGTLQSEVPEEVRSGLNWSGEKQFFFLVQVLPLPASPLPPVYEGEDVVDELSEELSPTELEAMNVILPETAAVVQARNSVAAAWLWRRYAANTQWNGRAIYMTPMCGVIGEPD